MTDTYTPPRQAPAVCADLGTPGVIDTSSGKLRIFEQGQGQPIVFVHGMSVNAAVWRRVLPLLADRYRCIAVDWPFGAHGIAMSDGANLSSTGIADLVAETLGLLDLHDVTLVGNDGGGMLCQLVVTRRPERVGRLVLTNCDAYENFPPRDFAYLCHLARVPLTLYGFARLLRFRPVRRALAHWRFGYGGLSYTAPGEDVIDHYFVGLRDNTGVVRDFITFLRSVDNRDTLAAARFFPDVTIPVLVAWSTEDLFFPREHGERFARDFPNSRLEYIDGTRTWIAEDQPERLAELIAEFVDTTPPHHE